MCARGVIVHTSKHRDLSPILYSLHSLVLQGVSGNQRIRSSLEMCLIEHMLECIFVLDFFYGFSITREQL